MVSVDPTVETILKAAEHLKHAARDLERIADRMKKTGDFSYAGEAISTLIQLPQQCRVDLLAIRPLREFTK